MMSQRPAIKSNHSLGGRMSESAPSKEQTGANMLQRMAMRKQKIEQGIIKDQSRRSKGSILTPSSKERMQRSFHNQEEHNNTNSLSGGNLSAAKTALREELGSNKKTREGPGFKAVSEEASTYQREQTEPAGNNIEGLRNELVRQSAEKRRAIESNGKAVVKRQFIRKIIQGTFDGQVSSPSQKALKVSISKELWQEYNIFPGQNSQMKSFRFTQPEHLSVYVKK